MAEGAALAWKIKPIDTHRGPAASYRNLRRPLPEPPAGKVWVQDVNTKEWYVEDVQVIAVGEEEEIDVKQMGAENDEEDDHPGFVKHLVQPQDTFQGLCIKYRVTPTEIRQSNGGFSGTNLKLAPNPLMIPLKLQLKEKFINHLVQPHDSFESLCLQYKVTPTEIRQANGGFSGTNLNLGPNPLRIPFKLQPKKKAHNEDTPNFKLRQLANACPTLSSSEAKCYMELNDWDLQAAIENAHEDGF